MLEGLILKLNNLNNISDNHDRNANCQKKKFDFKGKKENAINSLFEVEHFLCDLKKICNTMCLYKILK